MIGLLTETIGSPTPNGHSVRAGAESAEQRPAVSDPAAEVALRQQSIEYSLTANHAVLDVASASRRLALQHHKMGKNSIEKGNRDNWTMYPHRIDAVNAGGGEGTLATPGWCGAHERGPGGFSPSGGGWKVPYEVLRDPAQRDPRSAYMLPADQADFLTATRIRQRAAEERHHGASARLAALRWAGRRIRPDRS